MRRCFHFALMTVLGAVFSTTMLVPHMFAQERPIQVIVDGAEVQFDVPPTVIKGVTYVPMRAVLEAHGASIRWEANKRMITATRGPLNIVYPVDGTVVYMDGQSVTLQQGSIVVQNRRLVPLRFISEVLGSTVNWDQQSRTVRITTDFDPPSLPEPEPWETIQSQQPLPPDMNAELTTDIRSKSLFDLVHDFNINVVHYAVDNDLLYTYLQIVNHNDHDIRLSFAPGDKKIIQAHSTEKTPMPTVSLENCTQVTNQFTIDPVSGKSYNLPVITEDQACLQRNAAKLAEMEKWSKENAGFSEIGSNTVFVHTEVQANDGSLIDHLVPAHKEAMFIIMARTGGVEQTTIGGSYKVVGEETAHTPFKLTYSVSEQLDFGEYEFIYKWPFQR